MCLAKNINTRQLAAVKIVPKTLTPTAKRKHDSNVKTDKVGTNGLSDGIEREVFLMKLIEHPNVMGLYVWEIEGNCKVSPVIIVDE